MSSHYDPKRAADLMRWDEKNLTSQMVQDFSTWEPFELTLRKQLNLIGFFFRFWLRAEKALHFFTNPKIPQIHYMLGIGIFTEPAAGHSYGNVW